MNKLRDFARNWFRRHIANDPSVLSESEIDELLDELVAAERAEHVCTNCGHSRGVHAGEHDCMVNILNLEATDSDHNTTPCDCAGFTEHKHVFDIEIGCHTMAEVGLIAIFCSCSEFQVHEMESRVSE